MDFTIYAIGDSAFLEQVMIAVAMLTGSNSFLTAVSISALISILLLGFSSMMSNGKQFDIASVIVGIIMFMLMFTPRVTTVIEDRITGQIRVVDNVPVGVAATGYVISTIGVGLTELMEQAFAYVGPGLTNAPYAESLTILNNIRENAANSNMFEAIKKDRGGADIQASYINYVAECTASKQLRDGIGSSTASIMPLTELIHYNNNSNSNGTLIYPPGKPEGINVTCGEAYKQINQLLTDAIQNGTETRKVLAYSTGMSGPSLLSGNDPTQSTESVISRLNSAVDILMSSSLNTTEYVKALLLEELYNKGIAKHYSSVQDMASLQMMLQAREQRNTKWAAEQSLFMTTIRPFQAFFEAFVYAVSPFLAVLLVAGRVGYGIAGKYILIICWIQLWLPLLSIINLFITTSATQHFIKLSGASYSLLSLIGLEQSGRIAQDWLAAGGLLAASVPILSFVIISGSAYTMNSIAGRLSGSGHINEKMVSPDLRNAPPALQMQAGSVGDSTGSHRSGMEGSLGTYNFGKAFSEASSSSAQEVQQTSRQFSNAISQAYQNAVSNGEEASFLQSLGRTVTASGGHSVQAMEQMANRLMESNQVGTNNLETVMGALTMGVSGNAGIKAQTNSGDNILGAIVKAVSGASAEVSVGAGTQIEGNYADSTTHQTSKQTSSGMSIEEALSANGIDASQLNNALAQGVSNNGQANFRSSIGDTAAQNFQDQASAMVSAAKSHSEVSNLANSFGSSFNLKKTELIDSISKTPGMAERLNDMANRSSPLMRTAINQGMQNGVRLQGLSPLQAKIGAQTDAFINGVAGMSEKEKSQNFKMFAPMLSELGLSGVGAGIPNPLNHAQNKGIGASAPKFNEVASNVNSQTSLARGLATTTGQGSPREFAQSMTDPYAYDSIKYDPQSYRGTAASNEHHNNIKDQGARYKELKDQHYAPVKQKFEDNLVNLKPNTHSVADINQAFGSMAEYVGLSNIPKAISSGIESAKNIFEPNNGVSHQGNTNISSDDRDRITMAKSWGLNQKEAEFYSSGFTNSGINKDQAKQAVLNQRNAENSPYTQRVNESIVERLEAASKSTESAGGLLGDVIGLNSVNKALNANNPMFEQKGEFTPNIWNTDGTQTNTGQKDNYANFLNAQANDEARIGLAKNEGGMQPLTAAAFSANYSDSVLDQNDIEKQLYQAYQSNPSMFAQEMGKMQSYMDKLGVPPSLYHPLAPANLMKEFESRGKAEAPQQGNVLPVAGARMSSDFAESRQHPVTGVNRPHRGIDYAAPAGTPVMAVNSGTISAVNFDQGGYGRYVDIDHGGGMSTRYAHLQKDSTNDLKIGQEVNAGDAIAKVGSTGLSTGPHLHFEVRNKGVAEDPKKYGF